MWVPTKQLEDDGLVHQIALKTAAMLEPLWDPIGPYLANDPKVGKALHDEAVAGVLLGAVISATGQFGSRRFFSRRWAGSAAKRMVDYQTIVLDRAAVLKAERQMTHGERAEAFSLAEVKEFFQQHLDAIATGRVDQSPRGLTYLVPQDAGHPDVAPFYPEVRTIPPSKPDGSPKDLVVVTDVPRIKIGGELVTMVVVDGVEAVHADEVLEFMGLKSVKQRITAIRKGGSFREGEGYFVLPYPDAVGRMQPTTFITLLALTAFVLRSNLAVKPGSNANMFANALLKKMAQPRAHRAEMLIRALAPAIDHQTKASTRLVSRYKSRQAALEGEILSLRDQLHKAHEDLEKARLNAEKAIREAAEAKRVAAAEVDDMQRQWIAEKRAKAGWQDLTEKAHLRIVQLEDAARRDREARHRKILDEEAAATSGKGAPDKTDRRRRPRGPRKPKAGGV